MYFKASSISTKMVQQLTVSVLVVMILFSNLAYISLQSHGIPLNYSHYIVVSERSGKLEMNYNIFFAKDVVKQNFEQYDLDKNGTIEEGEKTVFFEGMKDQMTFKIGDITLTPQSIISFNSIPQISDLAYPYLQFTVDFGPIQKPDQSTRFSFKNKFRLPIEDYQEVHVEFNPATFSPSNIDYYDDYTVNGQLKKSTTNFENQTTEQTTNSFPNLLSPSQASNIKKGQESPSVPDPNLDPNRTKKRSQELNSINQKQSFSYNWVYAGLAGLVILGVWLYKRYLHK